jgi:hypothetical protein
MDGVKESLEALVFNHGYLSFIVGPHTELLFYFIRTSNFIHNKLVDI